MISCARASCRVTRRTHVQKMPMHTSTRPGKTVTLAVLVFIAGSMALLPVFIRKGQSNSMIAKEDALTGSQVQRGPFMNTGSKGSFFKGLLVFMDPLYFNIYLL